MSVKTEYYKLLEHPLWQKKRQEILSRDKYTCQQCYDTETQLHVDHAYYVKGRKPWQYPRWSLTTLCKDCHKSKHEPEPDDSEPATEWEDFMGFIMGEISLPHVEISGIWDMGCQFGLLASELARRGDTHSQVVQSLVAALTAWKVKAKDVIGKS